MTQKPFNRDYIAYGLMAIGTIGLLMMFLSGEHGIYINSALQMTALCDIGAGVIIIYQYYKGKEKHDPSREL